MNSEKKNQHYIPKFYLRNFSYQNNKKQIGVFNLDNEIYIQRAKLKTQGSKNFFYGYDGQIEDNLSEIEALLASTISDIINNKSLPQKKTIAHYELLAFITLTDLRNPVQIENFKNSLFDMKKILLQMDPNCDTDKFVPPISHEEIIKMLLSNAIEMMEITTDLDYKLLINETKNPFITSDFPIVKYNQFLELKNWHHSKSGYSTVGLQLFVPINSEIILMFFDPGIYKLGNKKQKCFPIKKLKDIDEINILQFVNCFGTIYFDDKATEKYIRQLSLQSKKFKRANINTTRLSYLVTDGHDIQELENSGEKNLMIFGSTDCETKLKIEGLKIHSNGHAYKFNKTVAQQRPHCIKLENKNKNYQ